MSTTRTRGALRAPLPGQIALFSENELDEIDRWIEKQVRIKAMPDLSEVCADELHLWFLKKCLHPLLDKRAGGAIKLDILIWLLQEPVDTPEPLSFQACCAFAEVEHSQMLEALLALLGFRKALKPVSDALTMLRNKCPEKFRPHVDQLLQRLDKHAPVGAVTPQVFESIKHTMAPLLRAAAAA